MPWPVTRITSASGSASLARLRISRPSTSFITRSVMTMSNVSCSISCAPSRAAGGDGAVVADALQAFGHGLGVRRRRYRRSARGYPPA